MAGMILKRFGPSQSFGCYSERGAMSYFMFVALPTQLGDFLAGVSFPDGVVNPFVRLRMQTPTAVLFSELDFGKEGFGCPDGAIYVECPAPTMIFIEVKLHESYAESCRGKKYNSTIKGQLELRYRMAGLFRQQVCAQSAFPAVLQETADWKGHYREYDVFYGSEKRQDESWDGSWRRLNLTDGVKIFFEYLEKCEDRVYFLAATNDSTNPFHDNNDKVPRCFDLDWSLAKKRFCWVPVERISKAEPRDETGLPVES